MAWASAEEVLGKRVRNGCGALLGKVVRIVGDPQGGLREIIVRQPDDREWIVEVTHIRHVGEEVQLKGPREGYHIAPLPRGPEPMLVP